MRTVQNNLKIGFFHLLKREEIFSSDEPYGKHGYLFNFSNPAMTSRESVILGNTYRCIVVQGSDKGSVTLQSANHEFNINIQFKGVQAPNTDPTQLLLLRTFLLYKDIHPTSPNT